MKVQIDTDGRTVWVNNDRGYCIGRFSAKGIDVHTTGQDTHCLYCEVGVAPFASHPDHGQWLVFIAKMKEHYDVDVPENVLTEFQ